MATITINGVSWDPVSTSRSVSVAVPEAADASDTNYILVQTAEPLTGSQRAQLAGVGAEVTEYIPDDTYLCHFEPSDLAAVRALPFVTWADVYREGFKVPPTLRAGGIPPAETAVLGVSGSPSRRLRQVDVVLHDGVDPESVRAAIATAARRDPSDLEVGRDKVRLTVQEDQIPDLAGLDQVRAIEEVPSRQLFNNVARRILNANDVQVNGTRFEGQGELVAVADTGFDTGSTTDVHPAFKGRVHKLVGLGRPGRSDDPQGHGTHVAGSVLGDGESATMGGRIRGTAPQATLYLQSTLDSGGGLGGLPPDLRDLFTPAYQESARVHTNSWGSTVPGLPYDSSAREIDAMVWENQDLVICFAAGNDGTDDNGNGVVDAGSIGSQAAAKNCITVGASENDRPDFAHTYGEYWPGNFRVKPLSTDLQADDPEGMVAFSSRGPTQEGRIKPDVVAPGTCILSTLSRAVRRPSTDFGESGDPLFFFDSGTSMATPLVAGCVAVLRSALRAHDVAPSAALVKAMLVNGAVAIPGQFTPSETGASPNANSGFGRVDLARSIVVEPTGESSGFVDGEALEMGGEHTVTIDVPRGRTLTATLVWTDPPGPGLQNDLDLIVKAGSRERHGNRGTAADFDRSNNVERVVWPRIPAGTVTLTVRAFRITTSSQPFACVWRVD